jgi:paired amphipathic helix protein Sin3a
LKFYYSSLIGDGESLCAEEYEGDKIDPLPDWGPSRENELPPKVDLSICTPCTPSYCQLPEDVNFYKLMLFPYKITNNQFLQNYSRWQCLTLQSSYRTELGRSIFNDTMVSVASGTEDCFKFRTKNQYEEIIIKCEDDLQVPNC